MSVSGNYGLTKFFTKLGQRTREVLVAHVAAGRDHHVRAKTSLSPHVKGSRTALNSGFNAVDSGFLVLDSSLCQWNLESGFQSFWDFRFLELFSGFQSSGFRRSTNMNFLDFGIRIPLQASR